MDLMRHRDITERYSKIKGVIKSIVHDPGRGAPLMRVQYKDPIKYCKTKVWLAAPEGVYTYMHIYSGHEARLFICNMESKPSDGGKYIRASGCVGAGWRRR